ncbi:MAG: hypothetical protein V4724_04900 [Pseudomonadota bacterium]
MKHKIPLMTREWLERFARRGTVKKSHKNTLFHTVDHFSGSTEGGQALSNWKNADFINEIKDLAPILEAASNKNILRN